MFYPSHSLRCDAVTTVQSLAVSILPTNSPSQSNHNLPATVAQRKRKSSEFAYTTSTARYIDPCGLTARTVSPCSATIRAAAGGSPDASAAGVSSIVQQSCGESAGLNVSTCLMAAVDSNAQAAARISRGGRPCPIVSCHLRSSPSRRDAGPVA